MLVRSANEVSVEAHGELTDLGEVSIKPEAIAKLFNIITEKLYEDPIRAITRELMTNMLDAWMQGRDITGTEPKAGYVSTPDFGRLQIEFTDYGPGLSLTDVDLYVRHILESSKDKGNEYHGGWGLGLKSPFAYTKNWTIQSRHNGEIFTVATYMQPNGIPNVTLIGQPEPHDGPSGLTVTLPVKTNDIAAFTEWTKWYSLYFNQKALKVEGWVPDLPKYSAALQGTVSVQGWDIQYKQRAENGWVPSSAILQKLGLADQYGNRAMKSLPRLLLGEIVYEAPDMLKPLADCDVFFPIGSLQVTPDRDRLTSDDQQLELIKEAGEAIQKHMVSILKELMPTMAPSELLKESIKHTSGPAITKLLSFSGGTYEFERDGYKFVMAKPDYNAPHIATKEQPADDIRKMFTVENLPLTDKHELILRKRFGARRYGSSQPGTSSLIDAHAFKTTVPLNVSAVYIDDIGPGSIGRLNNVQLFPERYSHSDDHYGNWNTVPAESIWMFCVRDKESTSYRTIPCKADTKAIAAWLGMPVERIQYVNVLEEPERDYTSSQTSTNSPQATTNRRDMDLGQKLRTSPYVRRYPLDTWHVVPRTWNPKSDPIEDGGYYVLLDKGSTVYKDWPETSAAKLTENWEFLKTMKKVFKQGNGDDDEDENGNGYPLVVSLPKSYLKKIQAEAKANGSVWIDIQQGLADLLVDYWKRQPYNIKTLVQNGYRSNVSDFRTAQSLIAETEEVAEAVEFKLPWDWKADAMEIKRYTPLDEAMLLPHRWYYNNTFSKVERWVLDLYGFKGLESDDISKILEQNNKVGLTKLKLWYRSYPFSHLAEELGKSADPDSKVSKRPSRVRTAREVLAIITQKAQNAGRSIASDDPK